MADELSHAEMLRYDRQISLRGFDFDGQERLKTSRALVVGAGGLGCAAALYLTAAGVGQLTLLDFDTVALSNLQRQILHNDQRIGAAKVDSAAEALRSVNPHVTVTPINAMLEDAALDTLVVEHSVVLDCTDNVATREQLNRLCYRHRVPLVSGAAIRMEGQISVFTYQPDAPCYRCLSRLFGEQSLTCAESGVMAPLVGIIGSLQAMEAIKLLSAFGSTPAGRLVIYDAMTLQFRELTLRPDPQCEVCGKARVEV
ncbi:molybdopterin-synthase adenylyltransferase MoeB [Acerihabitans sp. TG2]|uniref:molybdopterin-synthase adenylyltransferase MoeB n=1 Tax=Acerihabitans sp. TG2 TaxID=3096008 RepID=UPI002B23371E|nr:molybdopterin-synthase adenylyltransferase MoeB [Acerihabitans sp. TG2]MEA9390588.1 molybdopterin-synthase adenylyltransferase MoeB [Acerihabitans sp. TG2]